MSFASELKDELALNDVEIEKDRLSALFKVSGNLSLSNGKWNLAFKSENPKVAQCVYRKIINIYQIKPLTSIYKSMKLNKNNVYCITIENNVNEIIKDLCLMDDLHLRDISHNNKRIKSYLVGCFMGSGSVNNPSSNNYHLEMSFLNEDFALYIEKMLNKLNLEAKVIKRRNNYIVYIKKAQMVADFIIYLGATNSYFKFEDVRMSRDMYNSNNRLNNCEIANYVRTNVASLNQIEDIKLIEKNVGLAFLDKELETLARLRLENPEDSLKQLAVKYNDIMEKNYTKSGINHLFEKIKNKAKVYKKDVNDNDK